MQKRVYLMESFVTYVNKGYVDLDLEYFPELQGLTNDELSKELATGKYFVDPDSGAILPKELPESISEEIKNEWTEVDGESFYSGEDFIELWDWHRESEMDFDKIKNEEHYFYVTDQK